MNNSIRVRKATPKDLEAVERIARQYWEPSVSYSVELSKDETVFIVAEKQYHVWKPTEIVGMALMWIREWNKTGYVAELAVDQERRRNGIGLRLVQELSNNAMNRGARAIIVETQPGNKEAMDFYLSNGFRLCGYNDRYYTNHPKSSKDIAIFFSLDL